MIVKIALTVALFSSHALACGENSCSHGAPESAAMLKPVLLASAKTVSSSNAKPQSYGKGVTLTEAPISLTEALNRKSELNGKEILVKAEVAQVCQSKGCWMMLKDGDHQVRVTLSNYSFFVPKDSAKREALVQGKIFDKKISAAEARHYAKDAGMAAAEVKKIREGTTSPWFEATGLTLKDSKSI